ncbi:hypothetical protein [Stenomitos frigidus]|uniref:DUF1461 domain-containing protein n=1 Tax=Stenomitos frigidus ULC18 TaxID=2107698 RepID=A0A2T1EHJ1_9CYAN|nr:hypothetical protein [Stenomitos frigidus]PSB32173.1 hypothetical protein C7B82_05900 [Stenomitos frigidus ULC18]
MSRRILTLLVLVVLPGAVLTAISTYYLFPEWVVLDKSYQNYQKLAQVPTSSVRDLNVAQAAENRHRLNCFAEGVGVLLGGVIVAIGIHGICTLPQQR